MRDSPNMSYCMFENTERAMIQIRNAMQQAIDDGEPLDLNQYERGPFNRLQDLLEEMLEVVGEYNELVQDRENDE